MEKTAKLQKLEQEFVHATALADSIGNQISDGLSISQLHVFLKSYAKYQHQAQIAAIEYEEFKARVENNKDLGEYNEK